MMVEILDRRALGAVEFVNAITRARITEPLQVLSAGLSLVRNLSGLYVIRAATGFDDYVQAFEAAPAPPPGDPPQFTLTVEDLGHRFVARGFSLSLPRKVAPQSDDASVLAPVPVELFPAAASPTAASWALLRARVQRQGDSKNAGFANALIRVTPQSAGLPAQAALTDADGEALVAVPGAAPVMASGGDGGGGEILTTEFSATVRVILDSTVVRPAGTRPLPIPDPQLILRRSDPAQPGVRIVDPPNVSLAAGKSKRVIFEVAFP